MKKYLKFGESRKEKALTNDNFFNIICQSF